MSKRSPERSYRRHGRGARRRAVLMTVWLAVTALLVGVFAPAGNAEDAPAPVPEVSAGSTNHDDPLGADEAGGGGEGSSGTDGHVPEEGEAEGDADGDAAQAPEPQDDPVAAEPEVEDPGARSSEEGRTQADVGTTSSSSPYANDVLADGPSAYFRFGEAAGAVEAADSVPGGLPATVMSRQNFGTPGALAADADTAVRISTFTQNGHVKRPATAGLPVGDEARTVEGWLKTPHGGNAVHTLAAWGDVAVRARAHSVVLDVAGQPQLSFSTLREIADDRWHHIAVTYDSGTVTAYLDGVSLGSSATAGPLATPAVAELTMAAVGWQTTTSFDEIAVYPSALPEARIAAHFASSGGSRPTALEGMAAVAGAPGEMQVTWQPATAGVPAGQAAVEHHELVAVGPGFSVAGKVVVPGSATSATITGLPNGTHWILATAVNGFGSGAYAAAGPVTQTGVPTTYANEVLADGPASYFRFSEPVGSPWLADSGSSGGALNHLSRTHLADPGSLVGQADGALRVDTYTQNGGATGLTAEPLPSGDSPRTVEGWVNTTAGGNRSHTLATWGGFAVALRERSLVMTSNGQTVASVDADRHLTDGRWHHVAVSYSPGTATFVLDGRTLGQVAVGSPLTTTATNEIAVASTGWETRTTFDEIAVYPTAVPAARLTAHFEASGVTRPSAPTSVTATPLGGGRVEVSWQASSAGAPAGQEQVDHYLVAVFGAGLALYGGQAVSGTQTSSIVTGLADGSYVVGVIPVNGSGAGDGGISAVFATTGAPQTYAAAVHSDGAVSYHRFSEGADSGIVLDQATGKVSHVLTRSWLGESGALVGSGADPAMRTDTYTTNGGISGLAWSGLPAGDDHRTVEGWVKSSATDRLLTLASWGGFGVGIRDRSVVVSVQGRADTVIDAPRLLVDGRWHHVAVSYDGASVTAHVDGVPIGSAPLSGLTTPESTVLSVAATGWTTAAHFDEIAVYDTPLDHEVAEHFALSGGTWPTAPSSVVATDLGDGEVAVEWQHASAQVPAGQEQVDDYMVVVIGGGWTVHDRFTVPGDATSATISGLTDGGYGVWIIAENGFGFGDIGMGPVTVTGSPETYSSVVRGDGPSAYVRFSSPSGVGILSEVVNGQVSRQMPRLNFGVDGALSVGSDPGALTSTFTQEGGVHFPASPLQPSGNGPRTVEGWLKTTHGGSKLHTLASWGGYSVSVRDRSVVVRSAGASDIVIDAPTTITDGRWHHVVATYDGTTVKAYVDGRMIGTAPVVVPASTPAVSALTVAATGWTTATYFDEIAVYAGVLDEAEVVHHFDASGGTRPSAPEQVIATSPADSTVVATWTPASATVPAGQSAVEGYRVEVLRGDTAVATVMASGGSSTTTFTGIPAGPYTVRVRGVNGFGDGVSRTSDLVVVEGSDSYAGSVLEADVRAYYRFSEGAGAGQVSDSSPFGRHLTALSRTNLGEAGALASETDSSIRTSTFTTEGGATGVAATGLPAGDEDRTVEGWVRSSHTGKTLTIASFGGFGVGVRDRSVVVAAPGQAEVAVDAPVLLVDGRWHHVAVTYAAGSVTAYVDGRPIGTAPLAALSTPAHTTLNVAATGWATDASFDEVAVYGEALSAATIDLHFDLSGNSRATAPGSVTVTAVDGDAVTVSWAPSTAGVPQGQAQVDDYVVVALAGGWVTHAGLIVPGDSTSATLTGLTDGTYVVLVAGENGFGLGDVGYAIATVSGSPSTYSSTVRADGPSSYVRFSEEAGAGMATDLVSGATARQMPRTSFGAAGALSIDHDPALTVSTFTTNGGVHFLEREGLPAGNSARTVEGWFRSSHGGHRVHTLASWGGFDVSVRDRSILVRSSGVGDVVIDAPATLTDGRWHHVVASYDGTAVTAYVDGSAIGSATTSAPLSTPSRSALSVAAVGWETTTTFDEIAVYPVALDAQAVTEHFQASGASRPTAPGSLTVTSPADGSLEANWEASTAGVPIGQSPVDSYLAEARLGGAVVASRTLPGGHLTTGFVDLSPGIYTIAVRAINGFGAGEASISAPIVVEGNAQPYPHLVASDGAVAHYRFSEPAGAAAAADSSPAGRHLDLRQKVTFGTEGALRTSSDPSVTTSTFTTDGGLSEVARPGLPAGDGARSVEGWLRTGTGGNRLHTLAAWGGFSVSVQDRSVVVGVSASSSLVFEAPGVIADGSWHHVAVTYDGGAVTAYLDGLDLGTQTITALSTPASAKLSVAATGWTTTTSFDEIAIYSSALSPASVRQRILSAGYPLRSGTEDVEAVSLGADVEVPAGVGPAWFAVELEPGRKLALQAFTGAPGSNISISDPHGRPLLSDVAGGGLPAPATTAEQGTHLIRVEGRTDVGSFRLADAGEGGVTTPANVSTFDLPSADRVVVGANVPAVGAGYLVDAHEVDVFRFSASAGEVVHLGVPGGCDRHVRLTLRDPEGRLLVDRPMSSCGAQTIRLAVSGTYLITVMADQPDREYSFELWRNGLLTELEGGQVVVGQPALARTVPGRVAVGGTALVEVVGRNLPEGTELRLEDGDGDPVPLKDSKVQSNVSSLNQKVGAVVLDLRSAAPGTYDVIADLPGGDELRLADHLLVVPAPSGPPVMEASIQGPSQIRNGAATRQWVVIENPGDRDLYGGMADISVPPQFGCRLDQDLEVWREVLVELAVEADEGPATIAAIESMDLSFITAPQPGGDGLDHFPIYVPYLPVGGSINVVLSCAPTEIAEGQIVVSLSPLDDTYNVQGPPDGHTALTSDPYISASIQEASEEIAAQDPTGQTTSEEVSDRVNDLLMSILLANDSGPLSATVALFTDPANADWGVIAAVVGVGVLAAVVGVAFNLPVLSVVAAAIAAYLIADAIISFLDWVLSELSSVFSRDPNDVVGPEGFGEDRWISPEDQLEYKIRFENYDTATAPAQHVRIVTQLDEGLDWDSFEFVDAFVGGTTIPLMGGDEVSGTAIVPAYGGTMVSIEGSIDRATGQVVWTFAGPPNLDDPFAPTPFGDFLPPNVNAPEGDGHVRYRIRPRSDVVHEQVIGAEASITFDEHDGGGSVTPTPLWENKVDASAPEATVATLPATSSSPMTVTWSASDEGAGMSDVSVFVSVDGGPFLIWVEGSTGSSATYSGSPGRTYRFCSVARDNAGNVESGDCTSEAVTTIG